MTGKYGVAPQQVGMLGDLTLYPRRRLRLQGRDVACWIGKPNSSAERPMAVVACWRRLAVSVGDPGPFRLRRVGG